MSCQLNDIRNAPGFRQLDLSNNFVALSILPERGAEIRSFVNRKSAVDVLWKATWSPKTHWAGETEPLWMDGYAGGWQQIFPNGGDPCRYKGALLGFHGEASVSRWDCHVEHQSSKSIAVQLSVRLARSPFLLHRTVILEESRPGVRIEDQITNEGREELHYMWGHHPAYGAPFLSSQCRLTIPADHYLPHGETKKIPWSGDLTIPGEEQQVFAMGYLCDLRAGWYELRNQQLGFGVRWDWDAGIFPYVWLWQELHGSAGYPWYNRCYVMGVEPFSSIPGVGLTAAMELGTARLIAAGATLKTSFEVSFID